MKATFETSFHCSCILLCGALLAVTVAAVTGAAATGAAAAPAAPAATVPPPLAVDLNAFDASKKKVALPNGETLAYIDRGNPADSAVVLIHGYTGNALASVPLLP